MIVFGSIHCVKYDIFVCDDGWSKFFHVNFWFIFVCSRIMKNIRCVDIRSLKKDSQYIRSIIGQRPDFGVHLETWFTAILLVFFPFWLGSLWMALAYRKKELKNSQLLVEFVSTLEHRFSLGASKDTSLARI